MVPGGPQSLSAALTPAEVGLLSQDAVTRAQERILAGLILGGAFLAALLAGGWAVYFADGGIRRLVSSGVYGPTTWSRETSSSATAGSRPVESSPSVPRPAPTGLASCGHSDRRCAR